MTPDEQKAAVAEAERLFRDMSISVPDNIAHVLFAAYRENERLREALEKMHTKYSDVGWNGHIKQGAMDVLGTLRGALLALADRCERD